MWAAFSTSSVLNPDLRLGLPCCKRAKENDEQCLCRPPSSVDNESPGCARLQQRTSSGQANKAGLQRFGQSCETAFAPCANLQSARLSVCYDNNDINRGCATACAVRGHAHARAYLDQALSGDTAVGPVRDLAGSRADVRVGPDDAHDSGAVRAGARVERAFCP